MAVAGEHPASWTGRFVCVYERLRSGFQFSPIISNGWASWQDLSEHYSFYHFPSSFLSLVFSPLFCSLSFSPLLTLFPCRRFFGLQTAGAFSKPDVGGLIKHADFLGITDYVLQVLPERKRCPGRKRSPCGRRYADRWVGFHFRDLWTRRARMHVTRNVMSVSP